MRIMANQRSQKSGTRKKAGGTNNGEELGEGKGGGGGGGCWDKGDGEREEEVTEFPLIYKFSHKKINFIFDLRGCSLDQINKTNKPQGNLTI